LLADPFSFSSSEILRILSKFLTPSGADYKISLK